MTFWPLHNCWIYISIWHRLIRSFFVFLFFHLLRFGTEPFIWLMLIRIWFERTDSVIHLVTIVIQGMYKFSWIYLSSCKLNALHLGGLFESSFIFLYVYNLFMIKICKYSNIESISNAHRKKELRHCCCHTSEPDSNPKYKKKHSRRIMYYSECNKCCQKLFIPLKFPMDRRISI